MSFNRIEEESFVAEWTYGAEPLDNLAHAEILSWVRQELLIFLTHVFGIIIVIAA